jgi:hypothetical protein
MGGVVPPDTASRQPSPHAGDEGVALRPGSVVRVGRAVDNDLTLDDLRVSRHHAEITGVEGGAEVRDLASSNGTFVNGHRASSAHVVEGDFIGIGGQTLQVVDGRLRVVGDRRTAWFGAVDLVVSVDGRRILDEVGFSWSHPASSRSWVRPSGKTAPERHDGLPPRRQRARRVRGGPV